MSTKTYPAIEKEAYDATWALLTKQVATVKNDKKEDIVMYFAQESNVLAAIPNDNLEIGDEAGNMGDMLLQTPTGKYGENVKSNNKIMKEALFGTTLYINSPTRMCCSLCSRRSVLNGTRTTHKL